MFQHYSNIPIVINKALISCVAIINMFIFDVTIVIFISLISKATIVFT